VTLALSLRAFTALGEGEKPESACGETRGGRGLGALSHGEFDMNIREQIRKRLTFEQRRRIIRTWVGFRATFAPGRIRARNLPKLPNGRKWRTDLSNELLWSFQGGTLTYEYRDIPMLKQPFEVAPYMRLIWETKPGTIIEFGTHSGGSAVWMSGSVKDVRH
jgi:hypothetical protein